MLARLDAGCILAGETPALRLPALRLRRCDYVGRCDLGRLALLWDSAYGNLVGFRGVPHTRFTYHRTWETGLEVEI